MGRAIRHFAGTIPIIYAYTDNCPSLDVELGNMRVVHGKSEPGAPQTNGTMESMIKIILGGTRVNLLNGAPNCFYIFAADHYAMSRNILFLEDTRSCGMKTFEDSGYLLWQVWIIILRPHVR